MNSKMYKGDMTEKKTWKIISYNIIDRKQFQEIETYSWKYDKKISIAVILFKAPKESIGVKKW